MSRPPVSIGDASIPRPAADPRPTIPAGPANVSGSPVDRPVVRAAVREAVAVTSARAANDRLASAMRRDGVHVESAESAEVSSASLRGLLEHLRATVTEYVHGRRTDGLPIERVLPEVKRMVREAQSSEPWWDPTDALAAQVVRWTIEAYYVVPALRHVPRFI